MSDMSSDVSNHIWCHHMSSDTILYDVGRGINQIIIIIIKLINHHNDQFIVDPRFSADSSKQQLVVNLRPRSSRASALDWIWNDLNSKRMRLMICVFSYFSCLFSVLLEIFFDSNGNGAPRNKFWTRESTACSIALRREPSRSAWVPTWDQHWFQSLKVEGKFSTLLFQKTWNSIHSWWGCEHPNTEWFREKKGSQGTKSTRLSGAWQCTSQDETLQRRQMSNAKCDLQRTRR